MHSMQMAESGEIGGYAALVVSGESSVMCGEVAVAAPPLVLVLMVACGCLAACYCCSGTA
jgi:hypothetical protein